MFPAVDGPDLAALEEIFRLFDKAEVAIKRVEVFDGLVVLPAINELRYVGYHTYKALGLTSQAERAAEFGRARNHAKRALFDAAEAGAIFCLNDARRFDQDYATVVITDVVADYLQIKGEFRSVQEFIQAANEDRETREAHADACEEAFSRLAPHMRRLNDARPELNKLKVGSRWNFWLLTAGAAAASVAAVFAALAYFGQPVASQMDQAPSISAAAPTAHASPH